MSSDAESFRGRRVFVTGHTGFKGSWLLLWLRKLGADVTGYSLAALPGSMYEQLALDSACESIEADVRDLDALSAAIERVQPDVLFHMAAQALVLPSYDDPLGTLQTNVMGTANVLEAVRRAGRPCSVVIVTSDKCYENREWVFAYRETDPLGGHDPYAASKAAAELVTSSYRSSFFAASDTIRVASARAGNVIGGGDIAEGRIVPDCIRALSRSESIGVHNPRSIRPWQHVLEPLSGYLLLASKLLAGESVREAWNFAPDVQSTRTVEDLVRAVIAAWGSGDWVSASREQPHETRTLRIAIDKASALLGWLPRWSFEEAVNRTVAWYRAAHDGGSADAMRAFSEAQIEAYEHA